MVGVEVEKCDDKADRRDEARVGRVVGDKAGYPEGTKWEAVGGATRA